MTQIGQWASWIGNIGDGDDSGGVQGVSLGPAGAPGAIGSGTSGTGGIGGEGGGAGYGGGGGGGGAGGAEESRGGGGRSGRGGGGDKTMEGRRAQMMPSVMDQLRKEGVPEKNLRAAAAHLTGQAEMESGIAPGTTHDVGTGFGIYGARLGRRAAMLKWMGEHGYGKTSLEGQARYMAHEAMSGRYPKTRGILMRADPSTFARDVPIITKEFEAPKVVNMRTGAVVNAFRNQGSISGGGVDDSRPGGMYRARLRSGGAPMGGRGGGNASASAPYSGSTLRAHYTEPYHFGPRHGVIELPGGGSVPFVSGQNRAHPSSPAGVYGVGGQTWRQKLHGESFPMTNKYDPHIGRTRSALFIHRANRGATLGCIGIASQHFSRVQAAINQGRIRQLNITE